MAKHGKTRKQKMLADLRRKASNQDTKSTDSTSYSIVASKPIPEQANADQSRLTQIKSAKTHVSTVDYQYLRNDLLRTLLLTCSIVIAELTIKYFLKGM